MTESSPPPQSATWSGGNTQIARRVARPMIRFLAQETASAVVLLGVTAVALIWANSAWSDSYHRFWSTEIDLALGSWRPLDHGGEALTLKGFVNDALMAMFFFVVGLEIATEFVAGELRDRRVAALPAIAALGGMAVPAALFFAINVGGDGAEGWGIPMATDIAFAVGVLALLGPRVPRPLKIFMLTLAIVDDIGAIVVIAVFYTAELSLPWLLTALGGVLVVVGLRRARMWYTPVYAVIGLVIWYATFRSGVHATIAGVTLGLLTPAIPLLGGRRLEAVEEFVSGEAADPESVRRATWQLRESTPVSTRLIALLSPWTSFVVIPVFALSNAGVALSGDALSDAATSPITIGVVVGLAIGKPVGVIGATLLAHRFGIARLSPSLTTRHVIGAGAIAGIGFTVALFVTDLSFTEGALIDEAIIGILVASVLSALAGVAILARAPRYAEDTELVG